MKWTTIGDIHESLMVPQFTEQQILDLQDLFLNYGHHYINFSSFGQARAVISLFAKSLPSLSRIACLTTSSCTIPDGVDNLYSELALDGALGFDYSRIDEFLLNKFYYDFLWIECSEELMQAPWFYYLEKRLHDYNIASTMSIIMVTV